MLSREKRINRSGQYSEIYNNGKRIPGRYIIVFVKPNLLGITRVGIVTSKKLGNAVTRNRVKRQLRGLIQKDWNVIRPGYDVAVIARKNIPGTAFNLMEKDFYIVMRKAGLC